MLQYENHHIMTNTDTTKKTKITARQITEKSNPGTPNTKPPQLERKLIYLGNLSKNASEQDIFELFGLRTSSYLFENRFIEMPAG